MYNGSRSSSSLCCDTTHGDVGGDIWVAWHPKVTEHWVHRLSKSVNGTSLPQPPSSTCLHHRAITGRAGLLRLWRGLNHLFRTLLFFGTGRQVLVAVASTKTASANHHCNGAIAHTAALVSVQRVSLVLLLLLKIMSTVTLLPLGHLLLLLLVLL